MGLFIEFLLLDKSFVKNNIILIFGIVISNILAYAFHLLAGRLLKPEDYGAFGSLMSLYVVAYLPGIALLVGMTRYTSEFFSQRDFSSLSSLNAKIQKQVLFFSIGMMLVIFVLASPIQFYLRLSSIIPILWIGFSMPFAMLLPIHRGILQGMKKFKALSLNNFWEAFSRLCFLLIFIFFNYSLNGAILAFGLSYLISYFLVFSSIKELKVTKSTIEPIQMSNVWKFIYQVFIVNLLFQLVLNVPTFFIKHYYSSSLTGYWTAAMNISRISLFFTSAISMVMFPEIVSSINEKTKRQIFQKSLYMLIICSGSIALILFLFPDLIISLLYGKEYAEASAILKYLGVIMIAFCILQLRIDYYLSKLK